MAAPSRHFLHDELMALGFDTESISSLSHVMETQKITMVQALENLNKVNHRVLIESLGPLLGSPVVHLEDRDVPQNILDLLPKDLAQKFRVIPLDRNANNLIVATGSPQNPDMIKAIQMRTNFFARTVLASESKISEALKKHYGNSIDMSTLKVDEAGFEDETNSRREIGGDSSDDAGISKLAYFILQQCLAMGASDIHVEPYETEMRIRLRIDGSLVEIQKVKLAWKDALLTKFKIMANMNISDKRLPQDKNLSVSIMGKPLDFRVNSCPTAYGEKIVMRILDKSSLQTDMTKLGFDPIDLAKFKESIHQANGMVLVTGPTGSGKTVTLYSALAELNKITDNIVTAEDPVEFTLPGINQVPIRDDTGLTFPVALRAFLRQDPDIIMVGEIRDLQTAEIAIKAALTGHMVLSTLHTNSAPETVTRLLNMGVEPFNLVSALTCVVAQRLLRRNCVKCLIPDPDVTIKVLVDLGFTPGFAAKAKPMKGKGCATCGNSGEKGRIAIHEVLVMSETVRQAVADRVPPMEFKQVCMRSGMRTLRQAALFKMSQGLVSLKEAVAGTMADAPSETDE
jgi:type IV pilus assembly protein PilB